MEMTAKKSFTAIRIGPIQRRSWVGYSPSSLVLRPPPLRNRLFPAISCHQAAVAAMTASD